MQAGSPIGLLLALTYAVGGGVIPPHQTLGITLNSDHNRFDADSDANSISMTGDQRSHALDSDNRAVDINGDSNSVNIENEVI